VVAPQAATRRRGNCATRTVLRNFSTSDFSGPFSEASGRATDSTRNTPTISRRIVEVVSWFIVYHRMCR
jgi:hypothetical protein